jgi:2-deoxy-D-gluconate 3-dehydrogenase
MDHATTTPPLGLRLVTPKIAKIRSLLMNLFDLTGKVAIVTGGNGGIGFGIAEGIASCGANIVISGRNAKKGAAALDSLHAGGAEAAFIQADVTKNADCLGLINQAEVRFGRVDILVNNAGQVIDKTPQDHTEDDWNRVLDTNLTSAFRCSQAAYHAMVKRGVARSSI